jgi:p-aminobenzoyl-glutamate transporter AbgT
VDDYVVCRFHVLGHFHAFFSSSEMELVQRLPGAMQLVAKGLPKRAIIKVIAHYSLRCRIRLEPLQSQAVS